MKDKITWLLAFHLLLKSSIQTQILFNEFTPKGGKVGILAKNAIDKIIEFSIQDNGIGMNQNIIDNLFRIDVQTNRKGIEGESSTGLGLLFCKELTEINGGKIWMEIEEADRSTGKSGVSTFYFTLPIYTPLELESNNSFEILYPENEVQINPEFWLKNII